MVCCVVLGLTHLGFVMWFGFRSGYFGIVPIGKGDDGCCGLMMKWKWGNRIRVFFSHVFERGVINLSSTSFNII